MQNILLFLIIIGLSTQSNIISFTQGNNLKNSFGVVIGLAGNDSVLHNSSIGKKFFTLSGYRHEIF